MNDFSRAARISQLKPMADANYYSPANFDSWWLANRQWERDADSLRVAYQNACYSFSAGKINAEQFKLIKAERDNHYQLMPDVFDWKDRGGGGGYYGGDGDAGMWAAIHGAAAIM